MVTPESESIARLSYYARQISADEYNDDQFEARLLHLSAESDARAFKAYVHTKPTAILVSENVLDDEHKLSLDREIGSNTQELDYEARMFFCMKWIDLEGRAPQVSNVPLEAPTTVPQKQEVTLVTREQIVHAA